MSLRLVSAAPPHAGDDRKDAGADAAADAGRGQRWRRMLQAKMTLLSKCNAVPEGFWVFAKVSLLGESLVK